MHLDAFTGYYFPFCSVEAHYSRRYYLLCFAGSRGWMDSCTVNHTFLPPLCRDLSLLQLLCHLLVETKEKGKFIINLEPSVKKFTCDENLSQIPLNYRGSRYLVEKFQWPLPPPPKKKQFWFSEKQMAEPLMPSMWIPEVWLGFHSESRICWVKRLVLSLSDISTRHVAVVGGVSQPNSGSRTRTRST